MNQRIQVILEMSEMLSMTDKLDLIVELLHSFKNDNIKMRDFVNKLTEEDRLKLQSIINRQIYGVRS